MQHLLAALTLALAGTAAAEPYSTTEFTHAEGWTGDHIRRLADVDGDGRKDIVGFHDDGVWVALARETGFERSQMWSTDFGNLDGWLGRDRFAADVNGDGKADLIGFAADRVVIAHSTGTGFVAADWTPVGANMLINGSFEEPAIAGSWQLIGNGGVPGWHSIRGPYIEVQKIGLAVDGAQHLELSTDQAGIARQIVPTVAGAEYQVQFAAGARAGLQENIIAAYWNGSRLIRVSKDGRQASPDWEWHSFRVQGTGGDVPLDFHTEDYIESWMGGYLDQAIVRGPEPLICANDSCAGQEQHTTHLVGDVNGDGLADLVGIGLDGVYVSLAFEKGFLPKTLWNDSMVFENGWQLPMHRRRMADINGDGMDDLIGVGPDGIVVAFSSGTSFDGDAVALGEFGYNHGWRPWSHPIEFGDFDGDGHADLVGFSNSRTHVAQGHATGLNASRVVDWGYGATNGWDIERNPRLIGDVNGDGLADMVAFGDEQTLVRISDGTRLTQVRPALSEPFAGRLFTEADGFDPNRHRREVGDVNGDGRLDLVLFHERGVMVALGTGAGFAAPRRWSEQFCILQTWWTGAERYIADFNGDGLDDIIGFGGTDVMVALSDGEGFGEWFSVGSGYRASYNHFGYGNPQFTRHVGDFNGDGLTDVLGFRAEGVFVSLSDGAQIGDSTLWLDDMTVNFGWDATFEPRAFGDINGDGMDDLVGFSRNGVLVAFSTGDGFDAPIQIIRSFGRDTGGWGGNHARRLGDIDGDGDDDIVGFGSAFIYVYRYVADDPAPRTEIVSNDMTVVAGWRQRHDRFVADVDGDGLDDAIGFGPTHTQARLSTGERLRQPSEGLIPRGSTFMTTLRPMHVNTCLWAPLEGGVARQVDCGDGGWIGSWRVTVDTDGSALLRTPHDACLRRGADGLESGVCDAAARWHLDGDTEKPLKIRSMDDVHQCVAVLDGSLQALAPLVLAPCSDALDQHWRAETLHERIRTIQLADGVECVTAFAPYTTGECPGTDFELIDTGMGGEALRNPQTGLCLEHVAEGALPEERQCAVKPSQIWRFESHPEGYELRAQTYTGVAPRLECRIVMVHTGFFSMPQEVCETVDRPVAPARIWTVAGLRHAQPVRYRLHQVETEDGMLTALSVQVGNEILFVVKPSVIVAMLGQQGVVLTNAQSEALFGAVVEPAEEGETALLHRRDASEDFIIERSDEEGEIDIETALHGVSIAEAQGTIGGPVHGHFRVGGVAMEYYDKPNEEGRAMRLYAVEATFGVGGDTGTSVGGGFAVGVGVGGHVSWGANNRYGFTTEVLCIRLSLYFSPEDGRAIIYDVAHAFMYMGQGIVAFARNIADAASILLHGVIDVGDSIGDWGDGALDDAGAWVSGAASDAEDFFCGLFGC